MTENGMIQDFLEQRAKYNPDKIAVVCNGNELTYAEIDAQANAISHWLCSVGVEHGDRVLLYGMNSGNILISLFGVLKAGAVFVPLHPDTPSRKLDFILQDCTPKAVIADPELVDSQECLRKDSIKAILLTSDKSPETDTKLSVSGWTAIKTFENKPLKIQTLPIDLAAIIYTSGSTKEPKGVMEPHRQVVFATSAINSVIKNTVDDVILCGIPLSFDYGLYQIFLTFQVGAKLILERDFSVPMAIPRLLKSHKVTGFPAVPSVFALLLRSRLLERVSLPDLRYITSTGDIFPPAYIQQLQKLLPHVTIFPMYGLTECKRVSIMPEGTLTGHDFSVGLPLPGTAVSIIDIDGNEVPPRVVGQLVVKGSHVMVGYWNDPIETKKRFFVDDSTKERFLYTGDYFKMDKDGFLYFEGRDGTFIKSHGQKISPTEIENFLCEIDGIAEAAAVGAPDTILGEAVYVFVSSTKAKEVLLPEIIKQCKFALSPIERPKHIEIFYTPLPKTKNGKIDRKQLLKMAISMVS